MSVITTTYAKIIGSHHPTAEIWAAETTLVERDLYPGQPEIVNASGSLLMWQTAGEYESGAADIYVATNRGGYTDSSATYVWANDPVNGPIFGWDAMSHVSHTAPLDVYAGASPRNARLSMVVRGDGGLVCVSTAYPIIGAGIRMYTREVGADWVTLGDVGSDFTLDPINDYPSGYGANVALATGEDGAVYLAIQKHTPFIGTVTTNVSVYRADAAADWATNPFQPFIEGALAETFTDADTLGTSIAIGGGQMMIVVETTAYWRQYAAIMPGTLRLVEEVATLGTGLVVKYLSGRFVACYRKSGGALCVRRLGSAFDSFSAATEVDTGGSGQTSARPALWGDDDGTLYAAANLGEQIAYVESGDGGATWSDPVPFPHADLLISTTDAVMWRGGACMAVSARSMVGGAGYENASVSLDLGGWTSWAFPAEYQRNLYKTRDYRLVNTYAWAGFSDPNLVSDVTITTTGTPTESFTTQLKYEVVTAGGDTWKIAPLSVALVTANLCRRVGLRVIVEPVSGTVVHRVFTDTYGLEIEQGPTSIAIYDEVPVTLLDTVSVPGGAYELVIWIELLTGDYVIEGRDVTPADIDGRLFTKISDGTLTAGTLTPEVSTTIPNARTTRWGLFEYYANLSPVEVAPTFPYGRVVSALGTYTSNGIAFGGMRGPARVNDFCRASAVSLFGPEKAAATETYPSRVEHFRTADCGTPGSASTPGYLAWSIADDDADNLSPLWGAYLRTNAETVRLDFYTGGAWVTGPTIKSSPTMTGSGKGNTIHGRVTATSGTAAVERDELVGGWILIGSTTYEIAGNTAGLKDSLGEAGTQIIIRLTENLAAPLVASTFKVIYPTVCYIKAPAALIGADGFEGVEGFRLYFSGTTPPEGYWKIKAAIGPADVIGLAHGHNTMRQTTPQAVDTSTRSGIRRRERTAAPLRTVEVSWQDVIDVQVPQIRGVVTATPDRIDDAYGNTLYVAGTGLGTLGAYVEDHGSTGRPVFFVPSWKISDGSVPYAVGFGGTGLYTINADPWMTEQATRGDEFVDESLRGGKITLTEV